MRIKKLIRKEIEVAVSKHSQPVWFRILKYLLLGLIIYLFWGTKLLWFILSILFVFALILHFWYRYKTKGWTKSYGMWKYHSKKEIKTDGFKRNSVI